MSLSKEFYKMHGTELREFFRKAQIYGYGNPEAKVETTEDGGSIIRYDEGRWSYKDTWYGGEPYSGITVIYLNGKPCWSMVYWGRVMPIPHLDQKLVLNCLAEALQHPIAERPWRGPVKFTASNGMLYRNRAQGGIRRFYGNESIVKPSTKEVLYEAHYRGGIINTD